MSSPFLTLKKPRRAPLPSLNRPTSCGNQIKEESTKSNALSTIEDLNEPTAINGHSDEEARLLDEVTSGIVKKKIAKTQKLMANPFKNHLLITPDKIQPVSHTEGVTPLRRDDAPSDGELMAIMMARLSQLEQRVQQQATQILDKDRKIQILKNKLELFEQLQNNNTSPSHVRDLEAKCLLQEEKIQEMELFLADYGLTWVGELSDTDLTYIPGSLWKPGISVTKNFTLNHDLINKNVRELNLLAGEGETKIKHTTDGARLQNQEAIPLTVYANGILLFNGPFRSISETSTQVFIQDLQDGYFPSELQTKYPDGIPFNFSDKREVHFRDNRDAVFHGDGYLLGTSVNTDVQAVKIETEVKGPKVSLDKFLKKLPKNIIKDGKIVPVRNEISQTLLGTDSKETKEIEITGSPASPPPMAKQPSKTSNKSERTTLLRIRTPSGFTSITMKLHPSTTINEVKQRIDKKRIGNAGPYNLILPHPRTILDNNDLTLEQCGITSNTVLHMIAIKQT